VNGAFRAAVPLWRSAANPQHTGYEGDIAVRFCAILAAEALALLCSSAARATERALRQHILLLQLYILNHVEPAVISSYVETIYYNHTGAEPSMKEIIYAEPKGRRYAI